MGNIDVPYAVAHGEKNICYLSDKYEFIPYETISDNDIPKKISELDETYDPYGFCMTQLMEKQLNSTLLV